MITMTNDQLQKIDLLDTLFGSLSVAQLKELTEQECVASKLRGDNTNPGILRGLIRDNEYMTVDIMNAKAEIGVMKSDFQQLLKILDTTLFAPIYNNEFHSLKQKHNIY